MKKPRTSRHAEASSVRTVQRTGRGDTVALLVVRAAAPLFAQLGIQPRHWVLRCDQSH
jgi:hypothetical protein